MTGPRSRLPVVVACFLTGCANASTDPHTGGLAGGITGLATGAYEQRVADKTREVADLDAANSALSTRVSSSRATLDDLQRRIGTHQAKIESLKRELAEIDRTLASVRVAKASAEGARMAAEIENARREKLLAPLKAERATLARMVSELEENQRSEAINYETLRRNPGPSPAAPPTAMADLESRLLDMDKKQADAFDRAARIKEAALHL